MVKCHESRERQRSEAIDRVVTNRYLALPLFFGIMLAIFYLTFNVIGAILSDLLAAGIDALTAAVDAALTAYGLNPVVHSLVIDGVFAGVGSVLSFLPIIVVLFFFLSILRTPATWPGWPSSWTSCCGKSVCPAAASCPC